MQTTRLESIRDQLHHKPADKRSDDERELLGELNVVIDSPEFQTMLKKRMHIELTGRAPHFCPCCGRPL